MIKKTRTSLLLLFFISLAISCAKDDEPKIAGLDDYSGNYRLTSINYTWCSTNISPESSNDLIIYSNGRFKRKIYKLDSNNQCTVMETLEGQITITGSFYESPYGTVRYDHSEVMETIFIEKSKDGIHNKLHIDERNGSGVQHWYIKAD